MPFLCGQNVGLCIRYTKPSINQTLIQNLVYKIPNSGNYFSIATHSKYYPCPSYTDQTTCQSLH